MFTYASILTVSLKHCCFKALSFEEVCYTAIDNHICLIICNYYNHIKLRGNLLIQEVSKL